MKVLHRKIGILVALLLGACEEEVPPISVTEFMENPRILEATMVRCAQNRTQSKYLAECINARDAVNRLEASEERERREALEQQSERKRQALRRTQEAAAEARRRAMAAEKRREEEEYLGLFGQAPAVTEATDERPEMASGNAPIAVVNAAPEEMPAINGATDVPESLEQATPEAAAETAPTDLESIREELKRRQEINE